MHTLMLLSSLIYAIAMVNPESHCDSRDCSQGKYEFLVNAIHTENFSQQAWFLADLWNTILVQILPTESQTGTGTQSISIFVLDGRLV